MKKEKNYMGFLIPKVWQILKCFAGAFHQAQTSYFWGVTEGAFGVKKKLMHLLIPTSFIEPGYLKYPGWTAYLFFHYDFTNIEFYWRNHCKG